MKIFIVIGLLAFVAIENVNSQLDSPLNKFLKSIKKEPIVIPQKITITWQMILNGVIKYITTAGTEIEIEKGRQQHLKLLTMLPDAEFLESLDHMRETHPEFYATLCDVYGSCKETLTENATEIQKTIRQMFVLADEEKWEEVKELLKPNDSFCPLLVYLKEYGLFWAEIEEAVDISNCPLKEKNQIDFDDFDDEDNEVVKEDEDDYDSEEDNDDNKEDKEEDQEEESSSEEDDIRTEL